MHPIIEAKSNELLHRLIRREASRPSNEDEEEGEQVTQVYHSRQKGNRNRLRYSKTTSPPNEGNSPHHKYPPEHLAKGGTNGGGGGESTFFKMTHEADEVLHKVSQKSHIPFWGILLILLVIVLVIFVAFYFCLRKYWNKFKESDKGAKFKGLDLKSVNLIGQLGKEKVPVQPESDGLTANMEENEEEQKDDEEKKEKEKLGRLQFKLDYDFNTTQVGTSAGDMWVK